MTNFGEWLALEQISKLVNKRIITPALEEQKIKNAIKMILEAFGGSMLNEAEEDNLAHSEAKIRLKNSIEWMRLYAIAERAAKIEVLKQLNEEYGSTGNYGVILEALPLLQSLGYVDEATVRERHKDDPAGQKQVRRIFEDQLELASKETGNDLPKFVKPEDLVKQEVATNSGLRKFKFSKTDKAKKETEDYWKVLMNDDETRGPVDLHRAFASKAGRHERTMGKPKDIDDKKDSSRIGHRVYTKDSLMSDFLMRMMDSLTTRHSLNQNLKLGVGKSPKDWSWPKAFKISGQRTFDDADIDDIYRHFRSASAPEAQKQLSSFAKSASPPSMVRPEGNYTWQRRIEQDLKAHREGDEQALEFYRSYAAKTRKGEQSSVTATGDDKIRLEIMKDIEAKSSTRKGSLALGDWMNPNNMSTTLAIYKREYPGRRIRPVSYISQVTRSKDDETHELDVPHYARGDDEGSSGPDWARGTNTRLPAHVISSLSVKIQESFKKAIQEIANESPQGAQSAFALCIKFELGWKFTSARNDPEFLKKGNWLEILNTDAIVSHVMQMNSDGKTEKGSGGDCVKKLYYWGLKGESDVDNAMRTQLGITTGTGQARRWINKGLEELCKKLKTMLRGFA